MRFNFYAFALASTVHISATGVIACSATDEAPPRDVVATEQQRFSTTPFEPNHEAITAEALGFLRPEIVLALQAANVSVDVEFHFVSANHFDDCNFSGGSGVLAERQSAAVEALNPAVPLIDGDAAAAFAFGQSLHTAQDFYAHSNWVELGAVGLVNEDSTPWPVLSGYATLEPSGLRVVEGRPPPGTIVWRDGPTYPRNAIIHVRTRSQMGFGLISGTVDYEPGDSCPHWIALTHEQLNKDSSTTAGREAQHAAAKELAIRQTRHEWCRFVAMTRARWGEAGVARLSTWLADPTAPSACP